jgi:Putative quorum-sensing-regulated virulence factor
MKLTFGKYAGEDMRDVPREYLEWLLENSRKTVADVEAELERRDSLEEASMSWMERVVSVGYKTLARQHHPDLGGDADMMKQINNAAEELRRILRNGKGVGA